VTLLRACSPCNGEVDSPSVVRLFDVETDDLPDYRGEHGTFLLFPDETAVPLSSVVLSSGRSVKGGTTATATTGDPLAIVGCPIRRLVVLDCKWRRTVSRLHPNLAGVPRVRLDTASTGDPDSASSPRTFFWRWHNSGDGCLSTIEAVYYAAWQVLQVVNGGNAIDSSGDVDNSDAQQQTQKFRLYETDDLVHMLWLFALQRNAIRRSYESGRGKDHGAPVPFSEEGKEYHRSLRLKHKNRETTKHKNRK